MPSANKNQKVLSAILISDLRIFVRMNAKESSAPAIRRIRNRMLIYLRPLNH